MKGLVEEVEKASEKPQKNHWNDTTARSAIDIQSIDKADFFLNNPE